MGRRPLVLVVGGDAQARALAAALDQAGADARVVELDGNDALSLDERGGVAVSGHDVSAARAVVLRQLPPPPLALDLHALAGAELRVAEQRASACRERHALACSALRTLDDGSRLFLHPQAALELHLHKPFALARLARAGVRVPESLATSDPRAARDFLGRFREVITKPLAGGAAARLFQRQDEPRLSLVAQAPLLLQRRVRGPEHRVYLLAGRVLIAFAVPTERVIDARERIDEARSVRCPSPVRAAALAAARALALPFCAVDLRADEDGAQVVLDVNPTPSLLDYPDDGLVLRHLAAWVRGQCRSRRR